MNHDDATNTTADREDASDLQQWIDNLLRSSEAAELEIAPESAHVATATVIRQFRRRQVRRRSLAVFAAAAAMVGAVAMWPNAPLLRREGPGKGLARPLLVQTPAAQHNVEQPSPIHSSLPRVARGVLQERGIKSPKAAFVTNGDSIAVPLESDDPAVTVVQLYPTTTTERRWRRELSLYAGSTGQDGG
jgi:hypothetical protein